jgi:hypothetical protein
MHENAREGKAEAESCNPLKILGDAHTAFSKTKKIYNPMILLHMRRN